MIAFTTTIPILLLAALAGDLSVELNRLDGQMTTGTLVSLAPDQVVVESAEGSQAFATRDLFSLTFADAYIDDDFVPRDEQISVQFADGSQVLAAGFAVEAGRATIRLPDDEDVLAATRSLRAVRFFQPLPELAKQWDAIAAGDDIAGDVLVIRKTRNLVDESGVEQQSIGLDSLEGVLYEITDESVAFEFDGTRVDVPRHKVEGIIYFQRSASRLADPTCRVLTLDGSAWNCRSCEVDGETLKGISVGGVRLSLPLSTVRKIDFSIGNLVFLSDLKPDTFEWKSDLETAKTPSVVPTWYRLRKDQGYDAGPLVLNGHEYEKGLALHSRTKLSYRLTREFARFAAIAGIDDRYRAEGNVTLVVSGDGKPLLNENLAGSKQIAIDLDLRGVRRLEIVVDFGEDKVSYGDYLNLCNARLLK